METGSYKPGVSNRRQNKVNIQQCNDNDGMTTEESDESKSKISEIFIKLI